MTGSLQIKNGKYYAVLNFKTEDGKRKQKWINTDLDVKGNKRKAEVFLQKALIKNESFSEIKTDILFCDYILKWLDSIKNDVEIITWEGYENAIKKHIYPYFKSKNVKLTEITAKNISDYYQLKMSQGFSANTVKRHHANIRKCLKKALIDDIITSNPADKVQLPKVEKYNAKYYTSEQVKVLLEKAKESNIEHIIVLCTYYGLRRSEVLGLKWDAVNFNDNTIRICNTVTKMYDLCEKERTKNSSSNRTLPLISVVKKYLLKLKEEQKEYKKLFGKCYICYKSGILW